MSKESIVKMASPTDSNDQVGSTGIEVNPEYVKICKERTMQESLPIYCKH